MNKGLDGVLIDDVYFTTDAGNLNSDRIQGLIDSGASTFLVKGRKHQIRLCQKRFITYKHRHQIDLTTQKLKSTLLEVKLCQTNL